ncbi:lysylphosphatidylglycerol synthase transmembrane domain-containing protein [Nocardioides antri]|uniref:Flippase-like domain-containing protein n=1 Tax=Nocardioides antri TaxID=2607659 RepID=A0A5B1LTN5_9ACTN|nr:lysylphosphatidylglycerol synthase transmembrane domain-containing protein [Nocardioides antri]KAA1424033.1 flippase-like domain-containing protein [Nocardioides antri]
MNAGAVDLLASPWARLLGGAAILAVLVVQLGADPFVDGVRHTDATAILVALVVTAGTTWCCAWRWSLLSKGLDVAVPVRTAYRLYYRSQLLNATLPGGVLGDLHRGLDHGRTTGALGRGLRSVVWDRAAGQVVQAGLAAAAVLLLPAAVRADVGWLLLAVLGVVLVAAVVVPPRVRRVLAADLRAVHGVRGGWRVWPRVVLASVLAALGHAVVFVVAARSAGVTISLAHLVALALVVLLVSALPLNVAGWGPREGATAWLFAAAGLGAATGISVAVVYGVVSLLATLPGLLTLVPRGVRAPEPAEVVAHG